MDHHPSKPSGKAAGWIFERPDMKREYNRRLFSTVAPRYDTATRVLSFGRDQAWKRSLLDLCEEQLSGTKGHRVQILDIACGTGDLTFAVAERFPGAEIVGIDLSIHMLRVAEHRRDRLMSLPERVPSSGSAGGTLRFLEGDMSALPFPDASFDLVTAGYALRNAPDLSRALLEIRRVLKPGGVLGILEFSRSPRPVVGAVSVALLGFWGNVWGLLLHGDGGVYGYIARSLSHYPDRSEMARLCRQRGFTGLKRTLRMFGLLEISATRRNCTGGVSPSP